MLIIWKLNWHLDRSWNLLKAQFTLARLQQRRSTLWVLCSDSDTPLDFVYFGPWSTRLNLFQLVSRREEVRQNLSSQVQAVVKDVLKPLVHWFYSRNNSRQFARSWFIESQSQKAYVSCCVCKQTSLGLDLKYIESRRLVQSWMVNKWFLTKSQKIQLSLVWPRRNLCLAKDVYISAFKWLQDFLLRLDPDHPVDYFTKIILCHALNTCYY